MNTTNTAFTACEVRPSEERRQVHDLVETSALDSGPWISFHIFDLNCTSDLVNHFQYQRFVFWSKSTGKSNSPVTPKLVGGFLQVCSKCRFNKKAIDSFPEPVEEFLSFLPREQRHKHPRNRGALSLSLSQRCKKQQVDKAPVSRHFQVCVLLLCARLKWESRQLVPRATGFIYKLHGEVNCIVGDKASALQCGHTWPRPPSDVVFAIGSHTRPQCPPPPVIRAVHMWLDHPGLMLTPSLNGALVPSLTLDEF